MSRTRPARRHGHRDQLWRCSSRHQRRRCAIPCLMTMSPARFRECIALFGWSQREFSRRLNLGDRAGGAMSSGKYEIKAELEEWLEAAAAVWELLSPDLREAAWRMECDRGKFVRHTRSFRPLTDSEAAQLKMVAAFHNARPWPDGWKVRGKAPMQETSRRAQSEPDG